LIFLTIPPGPVVLLRKEAACRRSASPTRKLAAILVAARPLPIDLRDPFLQAVAHALSGKKMIGPGVVHQVCYSASFSIRPICRAACAAMGETRRRTTRSLMSGIQAMAPPAAIPFVRHLRTKSW
jgi:hypothetical protein